MNKTSPPAWANRFLEWFCSEQQLEIIQGDLYELYHERTAIMPKWKCNLHFIKDVFDMLRPFALKRKVNPINNTAMFKNYLKVSRRNFINNKSYSLINLGGLIIGIVSAILIILYVQNELSYDNHFEDSAEIFRVRHDNFRENGELIYARASGLPALAGSLKEKLPQVKHATNFYEISSSFRYQENAFVEDHVLLTDSSFFDVFSQKLIHGDKNKLGKPNAIIVSQSTAERYFGQSNEAVGKRLTYTGSGTAYEVVGVMEDIPFNSHFRADILLSNFHTPAIFGRDSDHFAYFNTWGTTGWYTYVKVAKGTNDQFTENLKIYSKEISEQESEGNGRYAEFIGQPLTDVYLTSKYRDEMNATNGNKSLVDFLSVLAALILLLAWLNYINLTTARSVERAKEVGLRKVVGSGKGQIRMQFLLEALFYNTIACVTAVLIVYLLWGQFVSFVGKPILVNLFDNTQIWLFMGATLVVGTLASGGYPAFIISRLKPTSIVTGKFKSSSSGVFLRKTLVTVQFCISIFLCIGTLASFNQLQFMLNRDKGFSMESKLVIQSPITNEPNADAKFLAYINDLKQQSNIRAVSSSSGVPGILQLGGRFYKTDLIEESLPSRRMYIDENFFSLFDIEMLHGRNFDIGRINDTINSIIINEQAAKAFGYSNPEDALGTKVLQGRDDELNVIGIVKNYAQVSYQFEQPPIVFYFTPNGAGRISMSFDEGKGAEILALAQDKFEKQFPDSPFQYVFMDEFYNRLFQNDQQFSEVAMAFTGLAIVVALLGLIGFVSYSVNQRSKEVGIRKVMGASVNQILLLFSKDLTQVIILASLLATPLAYLAIEKWLETYVLQSSMGAEVYLLPTLSIIVIAIICVVTVSIKTASKNPVTTLRYE